MYLAWPLYAIHGTNKPPGIGRRSSSGCIRMYPEDAEELFDLVDVGTKVTVVDQPIKLTWTDGELFMEAHPTQRQSDEIEIEGHFTPELPGHVVDQVLSIFAGTRGYLDKVPINQVRKWETEMHQFIHDRKHDLWERLDESRELTGEITADVEAALKEFQQVYAGGAAKPLAAETAAA